MLGDGVPSPASPPPPTAVYAIHCQDIVPVTQNARCSPVWKPQTIVFRD
ncbi:hypothetical protein VTO73DRAFT_11028 [Trametes versicolor]